MKKFYFLLLGMFLFSGVNAQIITIPDANFKARLLLSNASNGIAEDINGISVKIDINSNSEIEQTEAANISHLNLGSSSISDLEGIQFFSNLNYLQCSNNNISSLTPIINLTNLITLRFYMNQVTTLNIGNLINLQILDCSTNPLNVLNVSNLPNLQQLTCYDSQLNSLNIGTLPNLTYLNCGHNQLSILDVTNCSALEYLTISENQFSVVPALPISLIDINLQSNPINSINLSAATNLLGLSIGGNSLNSFDFSTLTNLEYVSVTGDEFTTLDFSNNPQMRWIELFDMNSLTDVKFNNGMPLELCNDAGYINDCENYFAVYNCPNFTNICVDDCKLEYFNFLLNENILDSSLIINGDCPMNLGGHDVVGNIKLDNNLNGCDSSDNVFPNLKFIITNGSQTNTFIADNSGTYNFQVLNGINTITPVLEDNVNYSISPVNMTINYTNQTIPFVQDFCIVPVINHNVEIVVIPLNNAIPGADTRYKIVYKNKGNQEESGIINLQFKDMYLDTVNSTPVYNSQAVDNLTWNYSNLLPFETREINLKFNVNDSSELFGAFAGYNLKFIANISQSGTDATPNDNTFILNQNIINADNPTYKTCLQGAQITPAQVGAYVYYTIRYENSNNSIAQNIVVNDLIDLTKFDISTLIPVSATHNYYTKITNGNNVNFYFRNINLPFDDANNDVSVTFKIKTLSTLTNGQSFSNNAHIQYNNTSITTNTATTNIQPDSGEFIHFPDAKFKTKLLTAFFNNNVAQDLNGNSINIDANFNNEIEFTEALQVVYLSANCESGYGCSGDVKFQNLSGIEYFTNLKYLDCSNNAVSNLNLGHLTDLTEIKCDINYLSSIDLSGVTNLNKLSCNNNTFTSLDLSNLPVTILHCQDNTNLKQIFLKNGAYINNLITIGDSNLAFICADDFEIDWITSLLDASGTSNCTVNSYCSFTPGGIYYTINGKSRFDSNNNGCDLSDITVPNVNFVLTDGTSTNNFISNETNSYYIPVGAGAYTMNPVLENPTYFNISPATVNVTFPTQASPFTQNFCVTANGVHPDLEATLLPLNTARPGFDAKYKIIYKNKGNTTQSGTVNLAFNDAVLDLVTANPVVSSQTTNNLSWNFTNLLPFETREIAITLNVNSPMETPAVIAGDILNYTTTITSAATDDMPNDNTFAYNQTVANAFDPNDKICLEGATISPTKVGDYVHYMIRFENTGTFPAENVVVKDMIDLAKFDINSLVPIKGSHSFVTNITSGNKVEFIFENINLPFDDANNDGYVAFKIKTKPTLVLGDMFSNTASIYFDYNFPIVTNTATTTIAVLANQDFAFSNYFTVYPNPVSAILNITAKETIEVTSINIYNTLGQLVLVIPNAKNTQTVDVSALTKGNYFIKINSDKGTSNTKFIKN